MASKGSVLGVFVEGIPTTATPIFPDENNHFSAVLGFDVPINAGKNQVVKLEAQTTLEVFNNSDSPWSLNLLMSFLRDNEEQLFTNNVTLTNIVSTEYQRLPLAITWADFPLKGNHTYTLEIFADAGGASIDSASLLPIAFVVTHIQR